MEGGGSSVSGPGGRLQPPEGLLPQLWLNAGGELRPGLAILRPRLRERLRELHPAAGEPLPRRPARTLGVAGAGRREPALQEMILDGRNVRGGQAELRGGPAAPGPGGGPHRPGDPRRARPGRSHRSCAARGTYAQNLFAVRPSLGAGDRFRVGVTLMHVRDDDESIPLLRTAPSRRSTPSTVPPNPAPRDNLVAGLDVCCAWPAAGSPRATRTRPRC